MIVDWSPSSAVGTGVSAYLGVTIGVQQSVKTALLPETRAYQEVIAPAYSPIFDWRGFGESPAALAEDLITVELTDNVVSIVRILVSNDNVLISVSEARSVLDLSVAIKSANDICTVILDDVGTALAVTSVIDVDTCTVVVEDSVVGIVVVGIVKDAADSLTIGLIENRVILGGDTTRQSSDILIVRAIEALTQGFRTTTDDIISSVVTDVGQTPFDLIIEKTASDSVAVSIDEQFQISAFGATYVVAADSLVIGSIENVSLVQSIGKQTTDQIVFSVLDSLNDIVVWDVRTAIDSVSPVFDTEVTGIITYVPPPEGELPPGWYSIEETELAGIREEWLYAPERTDHIIGWFTRRFWAVYDTTARLRATDAVRSAAHAQGWTRYYIQDRRGKADIT